MHGFLYSFKEYWTEMKAAPGVYWLYLPGVLLAVWILAIVLKLVVRKSKYPFRNIFTIHRRIAIASAILGASLLLVITYFWSSGYYNTRPVRFFHLLSFFLLLLIPIISLLVVRGYYKREHLREIAEHPKTLLQQDKIVDESRKGYNRLKIWGLLVAAGYLGILFWGFREEKNLISIVLDNSPSMEEPLKNGKTALSNTFKGLSPATNVVITTFTTQDAHPLDSYNEIITSRKFNVVSVNGFFESPEVALASLDAMQLEKSVGSPISQGIWENFQFVKQTCPTKEYKNIVLLLVTDGIDNISESLEKSNVFFCNHPEFNELYPAENIRIIDVGDNFENGNINGDSHSGALGAIRLFEKANKCGYDIQSGKALEDYSDAVEQALKEFKKDWWFIIWTAALYLLYLLSLVIIIPPARS